MPSQANADAEKDEPSANDGPSPGAYRVLATQGEARAGVFGTDNGAIRTPAFMPVGTAGSVKALSSEEVAGTGADVILGNTYHLWLRPTTAFLRERGGLRRFNRWNRALLTDSGGFQAWSLSKIRKIDDEGITFASHLDGSRLRFTPESVLAAQRDIGADIIMALDECTPSDADYATAEHSWDRTLSWTRTMAESWRRDPTAHGHGQFLFPIVQGALHDSLREKSAREVAQLDLPGNAIGGLSVGEPEADMYRIAGLCCEILPASKPRYVMGVGTPRNLLELVDRGVDMFDCVMPTRNARNGMVFTWNGSFHYKAAAVAADERPLDPGCGCEVCRAGYSRAYLRHLYKAGEILPLRMASLHNIHFYQELMAASRDAILGGTWSVFKDATLKRLEGKGEPSS
jgi:queuine tRNA-ribosyltransferase